MDDLAEFANVGEVARRLGVSQMTVRRHLALGNMKGLDIGTRTRRFYRISEGAFAVFVHDRTARAPEAARE